MTINGEPVTVGRNKAYPFLLKGVKPGINKVTMEFKSKYRRDGFGLHKYIDPEDSNTK
eukprot:CAMPEP_0201282088 /NCGR_PEP_ID=MMETSP1317-20130820/4779_1 /ASSEMBLY_ACC=CAM_ASM_000770 /TAXON_ID=187299 /ORGANISM="Undescribed Undescribed, Strain Undescribed" /LENGTH=57 /DNA_ID=CAMNT_0047593795 /DNA_START=351 /DNA_END=521 /DNA_ORIENTATION=-